MKRHSATASDESWMFQFPESTVAETLESGEKEGWTEVKRSGWTIKSIRHPQERDRRTIEVELERIDGSTLRLRLFAKSFIDDTTVAIDPPYVRYPDIIRKVRSAIIQSAEAHRTGTAKWVEI